MTTSCGGHLPAGGLTSITGDERYLKKSKAMFDFVYDNFTDAKMGGGVYWINQRTSKNSLRQQPTVIAAVRLSVFLKDPSYLEKAKSIYAWQKKTLTDERARFLTVSPLMLRGKPPGSPSSR